MQIGNISRRLIRVISGGWVKSWQQCRSWIWGLAPPSISGWGWGQVWWWTMGPPINWLLLLPPTDWKSQFDRGEIDGDQCMLFTKLHMSRKSTKSGFPCVVELYMLICESKWTKKDLWRKVVSHISMWIHRTCGPGIMWGKSLKNHKDDDSAENDAWLTLLEALWPGNFTPGR